jgi:uncharacterized protein YqgC (DUF456 family)
MIVHGLLYFCLARKGLSVTAVWAILLVLVALACCVMTLLGLPGNWILLAAAAIYVFFVPADSALSIGWTVVIVLAVMAALAELVEFAAGALGVAKVGGSRRSAAFALAGSLTGSLAGLIVGLPIPIPILGPLVAVVLCASVGALVGAMLGEDTRGRDSGHRWRVGQAAFWGRLLGTAAKSFAAVLMTAILLGALMI